MAIVEYIQDMTRKARQRQFDAGHEAGHAEGVASERAEWRAWNRRRLEAEARGESFDEPVPGSDEDETMGVAGSSGD